MEKEPQDFMDIFGSPIPASPRGVEIPIVLEGYFKSLTKEELQEPSKALLNTIYMVDNPRELNENIKIYVDNLVDRGLLKYSERKQKMAEMKKGFKHPKAALLDMFTTSKAFKLPEPFNSEVTIPYGYNFSNGIVKEYVDKHGIYQEENVSPYVLLPFERVEDSDDISNNMLVRLAFQSRETNKWGIYPYPVSKASLVTEREIGILNQSHHITIADDMKRSLAKFFADLFVSNNGFRDLPVNHAVNACGWTGEGKFFPFTTALSSDSIIFTGTRETTVHAIYTLAQSLPQGDEAKAYEILNELRNNMVFNSMFAGCLASPLLTKLGGIIKENIGIDLSGKTSMGKTTIQVMAVNLLYGLGDATKTSWSNAKIAGIWRMVEELNNLPFIMDDSHRMSANLGDTPHDLINGKEGSKSKEVGGSKRWGSKDSTKQQYRGTILFNGEVPITFHAPDNAAGMYGRIFLIQDPPFPAEVTKNDVERLSHMSETHGGHFAKRWLEHIESLDMEDVFAKLSAIEKEFEQELQNNLYGRLVTKATVLIFSLLEFNQIFNTQLDVKGMIALLKRTMRHGVENVNVADRVMQLIVDKIFEQQSNHLKNDKNCVLFEFGSSPDFMGVSKGYDICYKVGEKLIITNSVLEEILKDKRFGSSENVRKNLHNAGYLVDNELKPRRYPPSEHQTKDQAKIYGMVFPYEKFAHLLHEEEEQEEGEEETRKIRLAQS